MKQGLLITAYKELGYLDESYALQKIIVILVVVRRERYYEIGRGICNR